MLTDARVPTSNVRLVFLDRRSQTFFREWDVVTNDMLALLRAETGGDPYDRAFSDLVDELSDEAWTAAVVRISTHRKPEIARARDMATASASDS
jgi:hypothetical protein